MSIFLKRIKEFKDEDSPVGDLVRDILRDPDFDNSISTKKGLLAYINIKKGVCEEARQAVRELFDVYLV